ncbi:MAG: lipoprotein, partial [Lentimicrobiaceae bacterium]|nr:lipoprotein [Lentimicrobiaceae bacterium]
MRRILLTLTLLTALSSCSNVLMYKHKRYYTEQNTIQNDTVFQLCQDVYYNPQKRGWKVIDAWHNRYLCLTFLDTNTAKTKKILNIETDTLIVTTKYGVTSVWDWNENADYTIKG